MSTQNGNFADENEFNNSFMSREVDTSTAGKVALNNVAAESGGAISNIQRTMNSYASLLGTTTGQVYNYLFTWASNIVGSANDTVKARIEAIVAKFANSGGHAHTGVDGQGPKINAQNLDNINLLFADFNALTVTGASGTSFAITGLMGGKNPTGSETTAGVIVSAPSNRVELRNSPNLDLIEDAGGQKVYGRMTHDGVDWKLFFYTLEAGVETAHNYAGGDFVAFYREVYTQASRPTIGADLGLMGSSDIILDIPDASATVAGKVSTGTQTFGGAKTFNTKAEFSLGLKTGEFQLDTLVDSTSTGASADISNAALKPKVDLTNASLTSVAMHTAGNDGDLLVLVNRTGSTINILHDTGATANKRFYTTDGNSFEVLNSRTALFVYCGTTSRWVLSGGGGGGFTNYVHPSPQLRLDGETILIDQSKKFQTIKVQGDGSPTTLGFPTVQSPLTDGSILVLIGNTDSNTLTIPAGSSPGDVIMDGDVTLTFGKTLTLIYDLTNDYWYRIGM